MSLILTKDHEFFQNVLASVDESLVIGAVDSVPFVEGGDEGSSPVAILSGKVLEGDKPELENYVVLHQGSDILLVNKAQLEAILAQI